MKYRLLVLFSVFSVWISCQNNSQQHSLVKLNVRVLNFPDSIVQLHTFDELDNKTIAIADIQLDSEGTGTTEFAVNGPGFFYLKAGNMFAHLYLASGYDLSINVDYEKFDGTIEYHGPGATSNNYLAGITLLKDSLEGSLSTFLFRVPADEFLKHHDALREAINEFHEKFVDDHRLTAEEASLLQEKNQMMLLKDRAAYARIAIILARRDSTSVPETLAEVVHSVPLEEKLMTIPEYFDVLENYMDMSFYIPLYEGKTKEEMEAESDWLPVRAQQVIERENHPKSIKEFFYAKNVKYWIARKGISAATDSIVKHFRATYASSKYRNALEEEYEKWLALTPGNNAPDFTGTTPEGQTVSLSDFNGKVVYVDVWATWCAPCKQELPFSKELRKTFHGNDQVAFLYVSIDGATEQWKTAAKDDMEYNAVHVIQPDGWEAEVIRKYHIFAVPMYLLIDQYGKIVTTKAPRPSSGKVKEMIDALLHF